MVNQKLEIPLEKLYPVLIYNFVTDEIPSTADYEKRLLWQKIGYLAQQLGALLDEYTFNWYKAGPYSPGYTSLLYSLPNSLDESLNYELTDAAKEQLKPMKEIIENIPEGMSIPKWFELVGSIVYLKKNTGLNKTEVLKSLVRKKPFFNNDYINSYAWDLLGKLNML
ncbi:hypothetical protein PDM80_11900 [Bacillus cereus group sp. Bcc02]|uniref:hypothetical protein n=1 Tax=Bacillus cereus group TaxID=86661 RepID=UPI0012AAA05A|nr:MULTISPECIES: hypothetical protein [Bacillus cereus group]MDA2032507.1 hypothetical protein [Bacillus cereus group sp. Bcc02]MDA2195863.1 hypothetical protein [Bacillus cereus group sp. Bc238]QGG16714.1 hypothetical protein GH772_03125 [Bacillus paranthracis]